ncbi:MAG TPA: hypothetical protein VH143_25925 [Kofleriaceae bacterium]|jgi:hypothetical protein|nr:hypothetical protein [Kofleriaceae bacterium]
MKALSFALVGIALALAACGDNASPCDYTETDDADNGSAAELTKLTVTDQQQHVCGAFDGGHQNAALGIVDVDTYSVDIETEMAMNPLLVEIVGDDGIDQLHDIAIQFLTTDATPTIAAVGQWDPALSDHGAYVAPLPPGTYDMQVILYDTGALSGSIGYRVRLSPMPACAALTSPTYSETSDATNGVIAVDYTTDPSFSMISGNTAETSNISVNAGNFYMIAGSASSTATTDQYLDRDTYEFSTDDTTNELAIRLDWDGTTSDLDYIVFEANTMTPVVASNTTSDMAGELAEFGVMPNASYWLWIGAFTGSTATAYRATVCGQHFFY